VKHTGHVVRRVRVREQRNDRADFRGILIRWCTACKQPYRICLIDRALNGGDKVPVLSSKSMRFTTQDPYAQAGHLPSVRATVMTDTIQQKLDRLDEAFLLQRSITIDTYDRHAERLRKELTLARIAKHSTELDELDVEGILAFAERVLPRR
jgi:hypothetical protein